MTRLYQMKSDFLKALAHPTRLRILKQLHHGERCVCEFITDLELEQSNISQHLAVLRNQDVVSFYKDGLWVIYRVKHPEVSSIHYRYAGSGAGR